MRTRALTAMMAVVVLAFLQGSGRSVLIAQSPSALANLVTSMSPGAWAQLTAGNQNQAFTNTNGATKIILPYNESMRWDPATRRVFFLGSDHGGNPTPGPDSTYRFVSYSEDSNAWNVMPNPPWVVTSGSDVYSDAHGYDHTAIDPQTRTLFRRPFASLVIRTYDIDSGAWSVLSNPPDTGGGSCCEGLEFFPERGGLVWSRGTNSVLFFNTSTRQWSTLATNTGLNTSWMFAEYNPVHKVMILGSSNRKLYKLGITGGLTPLGNIPFQIYSGTAWAGVFTVDPASGDYLVFTPDTREFHVYDVLTDTWQLSTNQPPAALRNRVGLVAAPISTYGVTLFSSCSDGTGGCATWIYKHAPSAPDTQGPTVPTGLAATAVLSSQINLSWNASTDDRGVAGYRIRRNGTQIAISTGTSYQNTGLSASTPYSYTVEAYDAAGNHSGQTAAASATTLVADTTAPSVPSNLTAGAASAFQINLAWNVSTDDVGVTGYQVLRGGVPIGTATLPFFFDTGLSPDGTYTYTVSAFDGSGNSSSPSTAAVATTPSIAGIVGGYPMPSLQDEKNTYTSWGWTWTTNKEPGAVTEPISSYTNLSPDIHSDTEGDDLWTYLMMYRRTGNAVYLNRASVWADYFKNGYRSCTIGATDTFCFDRDSFGLDHLYGWGLIAWYENSGDNAAISEAEQLGAVLEGLYQPNSPFGCLPAGGCTWYGTRQVGRHLLFTTRLAELTGNSRWIALRDRIINLLLTSSDWNATEGMYFVGGWQTDSAFGLGTGAHAAGARVVSPFQIGILSEAFFRAYRATGNMELKNRLVAMARFVSQRGLDPTYQYTGSVFGVVNGQTWHNYSASQPVTFWDPVYTTSLVNLLVLGYKYTGDPTLLNQARVFFNRGTKGIYGSATQRASPDNVVGHFVDTVFDNSRGNWYLDYNKGELQYTYLIFENGGLPTVDTGTSDITPPTVPAGLTAQAISPTQINLSWLASTDAGSPITYHLERCQGSACSNFAQVATQTATTFSDTGLTEGATYRYRVSATDPAYNASGYSNTTLVTTPAPPDTTPPLISAISASAITDTAATINWTTDEVSDSQVEYGTTPAYGQTTTLNAALVIGHTVNLGGLNENTTYHYRVLSRNAAGYVAVSGPNSTFATSPGPDITPPVISAVSASAIAATSVTISWTTDEPSDTQVEYGPTFLFGQTTTLNSTLVTEHTVNLTGLTESTSYHYMVRSRDAAGNLVIGADTIFATADITPPTVPSNLTSQVVSSTRIDLSWTASTDARGPITYHIERCQGAGCTTFAEIATQTGTTFPDTGLTENTSYRFRISATDPSNNLSGYSDIASATTPDITPPTAPSNLVSQVINSAHIDLSWTASTDAGNPITYHIERCQGAGCSNFAEIAAQAGTTFSSIGLTDGTSYSFRISATDPSNNLSGYSDIASATTPDITPPTAPSNLISQVVSSTTVDLSWTASTDAGNPITYHIERCQGVGCSNFTEIAAQAGTTFSSTGLTGNTSYSFRISATDPSNNLSGYSDIASATTPDSTPPTAPSNLISQVISSTRVDLSWTASTDTSNPITYHIERCQGVGCSNFTEIAAQAGTTFSSIGLTDGTSYSFRISATDPSNNLSGYSDIASATTPDSTPPTAPSNLISQVISSTRIDLSWTASTDTSGPITYHIERCQGAGCTTFAEIAAQAGTTFSSTGLTGNTSYSFRVSATDPSNNLSGYSDIASATTPDSTPPTAPSNLISQAISSTRIDLSWTASTDTSGPITYHIERCQGAGCTTFAEIAAQAGTTFSSTGLTGNTSYSFRVSATDPSNNLSGYSDIASATTPDSTPPTAPSNLISQVISSTRVDLSWTASTDTSNPITYHIERCQGVGCSNFTEIAAQAGTTFSSTGLTGNTSYSFRVSATDPALNLSGYSDIVSATTPDSTPPTAPSNLVSQVISSARIDLSWTASTDTSSPITYHIERCQGTGCSNFAEIAAQTGTTFSETGLTGGTSYRYRVSATDPALNLSGYSNIASATTPDTTAPVVSITAPVSSATVTGSAVTVSASASDDVGVAGVRFTLDGNPLGPEITAAPYSISWDTAQVSNGSHRLQAIARDTAGNQTPSTTITVRVTNGPSTSYSIPEGGGQTWSSADSASAIPTSGFAEIVPGSGGEAPSGAAMIAHRVGGVLVTETGVPASAEIRSGSIYVEIAGPRSTSVVIANLNDFDVRIDYDFKDTDGESITGNTFTLAANSRILKPLDQPPFNSPSPFEGTFAFSSSDPVSVTALRTLLNERNEQVLSTLPVMALLETANGTRTLPHIVSGDGYATEIILINPRADILTGTVQFFASDVTSDTAPPLELTIDGIGGLTSSFGYEIPPFGVVRKTIGNAENALLQVGSARITPAPGSNVPTVLEFLALKQHGNTVSETVFPAVPTAVASRMYVESSGQFGWFGSMRTGVAIANPSQTPLSVSLQLMNLEGVPVGLTVETVPGNGHISRFINLLFPNLPDEFRGVMKLTAVSPFSALSVRTRYNERGEFLFAMTPTSNDADPAAQGTSLVFPFLAIGGGYSTDLFLYDRVQGGEGGGTLLQPTLAVDTLLPR